MVDGFEDNKERGTEMKGKKGQLQECHGDLCGHINICYKRSPNDVFVCTRKIGHEGNHIACDGGSKHNLSIWKNAGKKQEESSEDIPIE